MMLTTSRPVAGVKNGALRVAVGLASLVTAWIVLSKYLGFQHVKVEPQRIDRVREKEKATFPVCLTDLAGSQ